MDTFRLWTEGAHDAEECPALPAGAAAEAGRDGPGGPQPGAALSATRFAERIPLFDKNPHVSQGAIVANKRLGAVLAKIQADQQERDRARLGRGSKLTLRQKERIRAARDRAEAMITSPTAG